MTTDRTRHDSQTATSRTLAAAACAIAILAAPSSAGAASTRESAVKISYERAALTDEDAARALYARIRSAARSACGDADMRVLHEARQVRECRADAVARAVDGISSPELSSVHREERGEERIRLAAGR